LFSHILTRFQSSPVLSSSVKKKHSLGLGGKCLGGKCLGGKDLGGKDLGGKGLSSNPKSVWDFFSFSSSEIWVIALYEG
jgi:hypothetical protein